MAPSRSGEFDERRPESTKIDPRSALRAAAIQLSELTGREPHSVSSLQPAGDGWTAHVEVTEIERIPDTASVMTTYRVDLDSDGQLLGYEQTQRYSKGQIDRR
ncbi:gas vesicle protein [Streptomyces sp. NPDC001904]|uniref:gas vesicle protein GvpO n=1 Tax=Streptomyces sp. NPDC001904 TaxID=3154531 RepID=UPI00332C74A8